MVAKGENFQSAVSTRLHDIVKCYPLIVILIRDPFALPFMTFSLNGSPPIGQKRKRVSRVVGEKVRDVSTIKGGRRDEGVTVREHRETRKDGKWAVDHTKPVGEEYFDVGDPGAVLANGDIIEAA